MNLLVVSSDFLISGLLTSGNNTHKLQSVLYLISVIILNDQVDPIQQPALS